MPSKPKKSHFDPATRQVLGRLREERPDIFVRVLFQGLSLYDAAVLAGYPVAVPQKADASDTPSETATLEQQKRAEES